VCFDATGVLRPYVGLTSAGKQQHGYLPSGRRGFASRADTFFADFLSEPLIGLIDTIPQRLQAVIDAKVGLSVY